MTTQETAAETEAPTEIERLREEIRQWSRWGVIEIMVRNVNVDSFVKEKEREVEALTAANAEMREALEKICEPITADGSAETVSACQALHAIICEIAQEALARKP